MPLFIEKKIQNMKTVMNMENTCDNNTNNKITEQADQPTNQQLRANKQDLFLLIEA